ncbi:MAG: alpha/beta hydrolase [Acidimicrobiaceae bacterium]|nr:alpha/beta hydrolase [Acidimicrobiaceae bacterium]
MTGQISVTTEHIDSTRGARLALHHFGGNGPTLMVCHATGFHAKCYLPMMPILTQHFDVWGVDFAGHGGSETPDTDDFAWTGFAEDALTAIDHIGVDTVRAFGHSMGATATLLAEQARPGVISAAWLFEPIVFPRDIESQGPPRNSIMAAAASKRRREFDSRAHALHRYAGRPPLGLMRADALAAYVEYGFRDTADGTVTLACSPESEAATFNNANTGVRHLEELTLRATLACGLVAENPSPASFTPPLADALVNGELRSYDGLGHFGPLQDPDRIAADVTEFLT